VSGFPLPVTGLPALGPLLDGTLWRLWQEREKVFPLEDFRSNVRYVRLKPRTSCRLVVFAGGPEPASGPPLGFLLQIYPDADRAREAYGKVESRRHLIGPAGYGPFLWEPHAVVAVPFPNDSDVPSLRHLYRPYRLKQALIEVLPDYPASAWRIVKRRTRMRLLAYKPGRRAVYRVDVALSRHDGTEDAGVSLHLKVENPSTVDRSYGNLLAIHRALGREDGWSVPRPRGKVDARSFVAAEWVEGRPLTAVPSGPEMLAALGSTGRALAGLHALTVEVGAQASPLEASSLLELAADLAELLPEDDGRVRAIGRRLADLVGRLTDTPRVLVHGDFHPGQVLLGKDGPVLVDLDGAGSGAGAADLGSFLARLHESGAPQAAREAFVEGYAERSGRTPERSLLQVATAAALFRRSLFPFRELAPDWPEAIRRRLSQVERLCREVEG